jgi:hypothetical protein
MKGLPDMKHTLLLLAPLALTACATSNYGDNGRDAVGSARFGESVRVGGLRIAPLELLEDSRCPVDVQCVRAGDVRITARIRHDGNAEVSELTLGRSIRVDGRDVQLIQVRPERRSDRSINLRDYRFTFEARR